jgi:hypothetical protein
MVVISDAEWESLLKAFSMVSYGHVVITIKAGRFVNIEYSQTMQIKKCELPLDNSSNP